MLRLYVTIQFAILGACFLGSAALLSVHRAPSLIMCETCAPVEPIAPMIVALIAMLGVGCLAAAYRAHRRG